MGWQLNRLRMAMMRRARVYKDAFGHPEGGVNVAAEGVLADLRDFCHASEPTIFDTDPLIMARREGRREVFVRIMNFLNLDEDAVQKLMEIDDGIGE